MRSVRLLTSASVLALFLILATVAAAEPLPSPTADDLQQLPATYNPFFRLFDRWTDGPRLVARKIQCHDVYSSPDQCAFVREHCEEEQAGIFDYLDLYYCRLGHVKAVAFSVMVVWLTVLFSTIGIAASDFFCVNLSTIASVLGMSESMAGVTFLALGNGSPDVFSTFAAMKVGSGSLAVGELIGAASFITAVVAGSMAIVRPFKVGKRSFMRDVSFFAVSIIFGLFFLADGKIQQWECIVMILYYIFYVIFVITWHWMSGRKRRQRRAERRAREHHVAPGEEDLLLDQDDDDEDGGVGGNADEGDMTPDFETLENGDIDEDELEEVEQREFAELSNNMRLNRPGLDRRITPVNPQHSIRPSLVGALEFRAVLSSLEKNKNLSTRQIHLRRYSDESVGLAAGGAASEPTLPVIDPISPGQAPAQAPQTPRSLLYPPGGHPVQRGRAVSDVAPTRPTGSLAPFRDRSKTPDLLVTSDTESDSPEEQWTEEAVPNGKSSAQQDGGPSTGDRKAQGPEHIDLPVGAVKAAAPLSPVPPPTVGGRLTPSLLVSDADALLSSASPSRSPSRRASPPPSIRLPRPSIDSSIYGHDIVDDWKRVKYWPYDYLPPPQHLFEVLFPTLRNLSSKSFLQQVLAIAAVPSVFLLTITLPVVEDTKNNASTSPINASSLLPPESPSSYHSTAPPTPYPPSSPGPPPPPVSWNRWLVATQCITAPVFITTILFPPSLLSTLYALIAGLVLLFALLSTTHRTIAPRYHSALTFFGFIVAITWISTIATEVVGVLKAIGTIFAISDAILGLTIFAVGNSLGDLVADITVARLGFPVMALSACFGGPMLNILLGIGGSGLYMTTREKRNGKPYHIEISSTLVISAGTLLLTLLVLAVWVPLNRWRMSRRIGWTLVGIWVASTIANVIVEVMGVGTKWGGKKHHHS